MPKNTYLQIAQNQQAELKEKGSRFIAYSYKVASEQEVKDRLKILKETYPDASHHCYAYIMGRTGNHHFATDAGEPGNSAGQPILRRLIGAGVTYSLIIVVRYFGGKKLGVPGLIKAYGGAAQMVIEASGIQEVQVKSHWTIWIRPSVEFEIYNWAPQCGAEIMSTTRDCSVPEETLIASDQSIAPTNKMVKFLLAVPLDNVENIRSFCHRFELYHQCLGEY